MSPIFKKASALGPNKELPKISISEIYHENTKLHPRMAHELSQLENFSAAEIHAITHAFKKYPWAPKIKLSDPKNFPLGENNFDEVISSRRAKRDFEDEHINFEDLSKILCQSYGITGQTLHPGGQVQYLRASPSAGALYPAEIYLGIRKVNQVDPGIYHYCSPNGELELLKEGDPTEELFRICCQQEFVRQASVVVLISGVFNRTKRKYGERGYRYVFLDVGHLGQNIYLACTALNFSVMTTCAFYDDEANQLLKIDGIDESVVYVAFVGR